MNTCGPKPECRKATPNCSFPRCVFGRSAGDQNINDECIKAFYAAKDAPLEGNEPTLAGLTGHVVATSVTDPCDKGGAMSLELHYAEGRSVIITASGGRLKARHVPAT